MTTFNYDYGNGSGAVHITRNPAHPAQEVGRYRIAAAADIADIISRAGAAQQEWQKTPGLERGQRLSAFLDAVAAQAEDIAKAVTLEQGKILAEARAETLKGASEGRFMVGEAARHGSQPIASGRANYANQILRRPRGVIFCIAPWNFPAMTPLRKICPAVAFGNAVILKPSQFTPAAAYLLADIAKEFFPPDLVQIAMVDGRSASEIISKGAVHGVSFTGSVETGKMVYAAAAQNLIPVQLELGGKNAVILNDTENLENAIGQIAAAAFQTSGQRCTALSRLIVHDTLAQEAKTLLASRADGIRLGDGLSDDAQMGPLCNLPHWHSVCALTAQALKEGATSLAGAAAPENAGETGGYFYRPTILGDVLPDSTAGQEEIFGPVLSILEYSSFDEAMAIANGTAFGLTSALFSDSNHLVQRFLNESATGMMHVNHGTVPDNNMPFGGIKHSGVGAYSVGPTAVNFYTSEHAAYIAFDMPADAPKPAACCPPSQAKQTAASPPSASAATTATSAPSAAILPSWQVCAVPGGQALLGTNAPHIPEDEEAPLRKVKLSPFYADATAVTNARFAEFAEETNYLTQAEQFGKSFVFDALLKNPIDDACRVAAAPWWVLVEGANWRQPHGPGSTHAQMPDHPVVHVSWHDAAAFAKWANGRLPSEAEWEHAARGGLRDVRHPWGDDAPDEESFFPCNIWQGRFPDVNLAKDGYCGTAPARSFAANGYGLYNMCGNVWEWTAEPFKVRSLKKPLRQFHAGKEGFKMLKGGSYLCHSSYCYRYRIAARTASSPDSSTSHQGFRLVYAG